MNNIAIFVVRHYTGTRFLAFFYHLPPPFTLPPFRNLFNSFLASLISLLILETSSSSCSTPLLLLALSLLLAFIIPTLSFLLLTLSVIPSILSSISLSLPTVHGLATPLFPKPHTSSTVFTNTSATSLQPHSCSPLLSHVCLIFSSYSALFSSFISPCDLTLGSLLSFLTSILHLLSSTFNLMHTGLWSDNSLSSLVYTFLTILCLSPPLTKNPCSSCHLTIAGWLHVPLLLYIIKLFTCAIPISSHQSTKSPPASLPLPRLYFPHTPPPISSPSYASIEISPNNNLFPVPNCNLPFHVPSASFHAFPIRPSAWLVYRHQS